MKLFHWILLAAFCFSGIPAKAADASALDEQSTQPLFQKRAADYAKWMVTVTLTSGGNKTNSQAVAPQFTVIKTGTIMLRQSTDAQGRSLNLWCLNDDVEITVWPENMHYVIQQRPEGLAYSRHPYYEDYTETDFPDFKWISKKNYIGVQTVSGTRCLAFKATQNLYLGDSAPSNLVAFVDEKTRLPVAAAINSEWHYYAFQQPPASDLAFPPIVKHLLFDPPKRMAMP